MDIENQGSISDIPNKGGSRSSSGTIRGISDIPQLTNDLGRIQGKFSPGRILAITISGIAIAEVIAMIVVYYVRYWPYYQQVLLDATVMTVIIFPLLYFLSFKPLLLHIQQRYRSERIIQTRMQLMQFANTHTLDELLQVTLDEIEALTGSTISFFHFLEPDQKTLLLQAWSTNTLQNMCKAEGKGSHYDVELAGVWADCIWERRTVIHNDYKALPHRKGTPEGHAPVIREMAVPIIRNEKVVAILGVGNKPQNYTASDVELVSILADFAWDVIEAKRAGSALVESEQKFRTLVEWTNDWEKWLDPRDNIVYMSPSCERITGYHPREFIADPDLLIRIIHPDDRQSYKEHMQVVHNESEGMVNLEYRIISRDKSEHWIDHICRPLFGADNTYLGRRVSNRDITERKLAEKEIKERNQKLEELYQAEQHARKIAEILCSASLALTQSLNLNTVTKTLLEFISRLVPFGNASVILFDNENRPNVWAFSGYEKLTDTAQKLAKYFQPQTNPHIQNLLVDQNKILINDTRKDMFWRAVPRTESIQSWLAVPISSEGRLIGLCEFSSSEPGFFTQEYIQEIEALVSQSAVVIQNAWLFEQVRAGRERLQNLSQQLVQIQENERRFIARELHDEAGQMLTSLMIGLEMLERDANHPEAIVAGIAELNRVVEKVLDEIHRLSVDLRPASLDQLGLVVALRQHIETLSEKHKLMFNFQTVGLANRLPSEMEIALYRIVQEALTNVIRHARASRVDISLEEHNERVIVVIEDNGTGFDPAIRMHSDRLGLFGMQERTEMLNGSLSIESSSGKGTTIFVEVPYVPTDPGGR